MPLVRIDLTPDRSAAEQNAISAAIHAALSETMDVPADDLFHVITTTGALRYDHAFLGVRRSERLVMVQVFLRRGRAAAQKRAFYARAAVLLAEADIRPGDLFCVLTENGPEDWSFGDGIAQYAQST